MSQDRLRYSGLVAFLLPISLVAQVITGRVIDVRTEEPLAFVHLVATAAREGTTTDIDGRFTLPVDGIPVTVRCSYVGYATQDVILGSTVPVIIRMEPAAVQLNELSVVPGENPAHRIIERVYANRKLNDGMRHRAHRYRSYSKTIFTAAMDSALLRDPSRLDSNDRELARFLDEQHILLIESATRKSFIPPAQEKEEVLAMRVSGLKDPSLLALAASTKTFSIYDPQIVLNEKTYVGPIGPNSTRHYLFVLEDTLYQGVDSVFVISYRPRSGTRFDGLKGLLYVNTGSYALQNVIAGPADAGNGMSLKIQQRHERVGGVAWFPVQLNTEVVFPFLQANSYALMGIGRTYLKEIELDADIHRREVRGPELTAERMVMRRDDEWWNSLRENSLDAKELKTYHVIDSLGDAEHLDRTVKVLDALTSGRLRWGPVDLDLTRILAFNGYEGFRLGMGVATNDRVSRVFSVGGYGAYGTRDDQFKFGGDLRIRPRPGRSLQFRAFYENDVIESGGVAFRGQKGFFASEAARLLYMDRMDRMERWGGEISFRSGGMQAWIGSDRQLRVNELGYRHAEPVGEGITRLRSEFEAGGVSVALRYAHKERIAQLLDRQIALGTKWPVIYANIYQAVPGLWQGDLDLLRVDLMIERSFRIRMWGSSSIRLLGGAASIDAPYSWAFNMRGTFGQGLNIVTPFAFETMRPNEFLADRYVAVFLRHSFGHLLVKSKRFNPVPVIVASAGWGELHDPTVHRGLSFATMEQGYYEAGLQFDELLRVGISGLGLGVFQRIGPYATGRVADDIALKLTATFVL